MKLRAKRLAHMLSSLTFNKEDDNNPNLIKLDTNYYCYLRITTVNRNLFTSSCHDPPSEHLRAPPTTFPRAENKLKPISLPEDVYISKFFQNHPDSKHEDPTKISGFDPPPACVFGWRVLQLKEQGVSEEEAMAVADDYICYGWNIGLKEKPKRKHMFV
ncbi:Hypothetical predicted protein [Olea europaea subsp. europaea]|uniref:Uncharacterized protein n=1 Tax=Olea europaea subsp. europaea TaxID=158383 RepID=A0A8S0P7A4_OLEEU|nr:Hypothetical predicted protein [Olea europaea subsp. europaea]